MYIRDANGNYVPVPTITGDDGREVELRATTTYIQWRYPDTEWTNLVALSDLASGFGTPSASVTALSADAVPTVAIQASGANTAKVFAFSFGIPRGTPGTGNNWYLGTAITGTSNTAASYTTGITNALVNDVYMNVGALPDTGRIYRCTVGGNATTAKWVYSCLLRGADGDGDMNKATYDTDNDGVVDDASKLGSQLPAWYQQATDGLIEETNIVDADTMPFYDASAPGHRKSTWLNIKSVIKAYFDTLYARLASQTAFTDTTASTSKTTGAVTIAGGLGVTGSLYADKVLGAGWNDYAEFRKASGEILPGTVVTESADDTIVSCHTDMDVCAHVVTDTYGFAIGTTNTPTIPIAVAGRVLVYVSGNRNSYQRGDILCSDISGRARRMTSNEQSANPFAAIGVVLSVPEYSEWGDNRIPVDGRIWMKVK